MGTRQWGQGNADPRGPNVSETNWQSGFIKMIYLLWDTCKKDGLGNLTFSGTSAGLILDVADQVLAKRGATSLLLSDNKATYLCNKRANSALEDLNVPTSPTNCPSYHAGRTGCLQKD